MPEDGSLTKFHWKHMLIRDPLEVIAGCTLAIYSQNKIKKTVPCKIVSKRKKILRNKFNLKLQDLYTLETTFFF